MQYDILLTPSCHLPDILVITQDGTLSLPKVPSIDCLGDVHEFQATYQSKGFCLWAKLYSSKLQHNKLQHTPPLLLTEFT